MKFDLLDLSELFDGALDVVQRVKRAADPALISQVAEHLDDVVSKVTAMYDLGEEAAQEIVAALLLVGSALDTSQARSRALRPPVDTEVASFDDLLTIFVSEARTTPTTWQDRVEHEHREVSERLTNLTAFLSGQQIESLSPAMRDLLHRQAEAMAVYAELLAQRIALAREDAVHAADDGD